MKANNMNPDQTTSKEQSDLGSYCLHNRLPKNPNRSRRQKSQELTLQSLFSHTVFSGSRARLRCCL